LRSLGRCRPLSGISCRPVDTACRSSAPVNCCYACFSSHTSTRPGTRHARSCLRSEQPASQNAFCRIVCPQDPKNLRVRIEVSLRWVYSLLRILFASPKEPPPASTCNCSGLASPHLPPASINGTIGVTAWIRLTDFLQPTLFCFQRRAPVVSRCYRLDFKTRAGALTTGEPLAIATTSRSASGGSLRTVFRIT
jgi:hypothetical protein